MNKNQDKKINYTGLGLILGTAVGSTFSLIFTGNLALWAGAGTAVGLIMGAIVDNYYKNRQD